MELAPRSLALSPKMDAAQYYQAYERMCISDTSPYHYDILCEKTGDPDEISFVGRTKGAPVS